MPSGAKRRKAAKKKKEKETNIDNPSNDNPQGNDDLKSQDEKGSDGGEVNSPVYHDQDDHHHPFTEGGEEVEERVPSVAQPSDADVKSVAEVPTDIESVEVVEGKDDGVVNIERNLKSEESSDSKNVSVEHVASAKESYERDTNPGGASYDESLPEKPREEPYKSIQEGVASYDLVESLGSLPSEKTLITENARVEGTSNFVVESSVDSVEAVDSLAVVKSNNTGSSLMEKSAVPEVEATNIGMKKNEDKVYPLSDEYVKSSSLEEPKQKEYDDKVSASLSGGHFTESTRDVEHIKDSENPESSQDQRPLVASAPHLVQKTSWLSCCGLFEVLSGLNR